MRVNHAVAYAAKSKISVNAPIKLRVALDILLRKNRLAASDFTDDRQKPRVGHRFNVLVGKVGCYAVHQVVDCRAKYVGELLQPQRADILNITVLPFTHSALRNAHEVTDVLESQVAGLAPVMDSLAHSHKYHRPCLSKPYYNAQVSKRKHFFLENRKKFPLGVYKSKMMRYD